MKKLSKVLVLVLSAIMVLAMSASVFAADGDITVNGPVEGAKYQAYKMFDVTVDPTNSNNVNYTLINNDITEVTGFDTVFKTVTSGGKTYVQKASASVTDEQIITWIKNNKDAIKAASVAKGSEVTGAGSSIKLATGELGYYMIWSSKDDTVAVSVDTTRKEATVNSKLPSVPTITDDGKKVNGKTVTTMEIGEEADFTITFTATNYEVKDGVSTPITQYVVTDTPDGFAIDDDTVAVTVNGDAYAISGKTVTHSVDGQGKLTVTIPWDQTTYNTSNTVVVSYKATLTNKHVAEKASNKAKVTYDNKPVPGEPEVHVYNFKINITKVEKNNESKKLPGAKFVLKNGNNFYKVNATDGTVSWVTNQADATVVTTDADGAANFAGLKAGTYSLVETEAPAGYNLASPQPVTIAEVTADNEETVNLNVTAKVEDEAGTVLPGTGGIGTTIFYVLGSLLVVGCGIVLISRKRMQDK